MKTERFENIGDNCEFGFVKRAHGDESGGLLRWVLSSPDALLAGLQGRFEGLYAFENLSPSWDNMVADSRYGFFFHTEMFSKNLQWVEPEEKRREIYKKEKEKIDYLVTKFFRRLADPSVILVFKWNDNLPQERAEHLADALARFGPARLLVVRHTDDEALIGHVRQEGRYLAGYVDRFAPYSHSDQYSPVWETVLAEALSLADGPAPLVATPAPASAPHQGIVQAVKRFGQRIMRALPFTADNGDRCGHPGGNLGSGGDTVDMHTHRDTLG